VSYRGQDIGHQYLYIGTTCTTGWNVESKTNTTTMKLREMSSYSKLKGVLIANELCIILFISFPLLETLLLMFTMQTASCLTTFLVSFTILLFAMVN